MGSSGLLGSTDRCAGFLRRCHGGQGGLGIAGGEEIAAAQEPSPSGGPAQFRRCKGLGPVQGLQGACWSYGEASVGFARG